MSKHCAVCCLEIKVQMKMNFLHKRQSLLWSKYMIVINLTAKSTILFVVLLNNIKEGLFFEFECMVGALKIVGNTHPLFG